MKIPIITLLTDFGTRDPYVGVVKGVLSSLAPSARLVDLTHEVPPGNRGTAAFLLSTSIDYFPRGTVHLCVVDPGVGSDRKAVAVESGGRLFVGPDNGLIPAALAGRRLGRAVQLTRLGLRLPRMSSTFHGRDLFSPAAAALARGVPLSRLGRPLRSLVPGSIPSPLRTGKVWSGEVLWVDRFGNVVTNLPGGLLRPASRLWVAGRPVGRVGTHYAQAVRGRLLALPGSFGMIEVSVNGGSASERLGAGIGSPVEFR
jgi:hypothetical protein